YVITRRNAGPIQRGAMVNWESETIPNCRLIDISGTGIGFLKNDNQKIQLEDIIRLRFKLDNSAETEIIEECEIKYIKDNRVGCRMLSNNPKLGFYLLS
ncbi:MAG: PilZ domain-containing protein, partial [Desulfobulbaceae bacterium]|nr:PilZ domain-containing protein [Desulfobulbaceae bacterium]